MRLSILNRKQGQDQNHCSFTMHEGLSNDDLSLGPNKDYLIKYEIAKSS